VTEGRLERVKCRNCGRLIFRAYLPPACPHHPAAVIEEKCFHCNEMNLITSVPLAVGLVPDGLGGYVARPIDRLAAPG